MSHPLHVPRPALLVIRFTSPKRFNTTINFYTKFLGTRPEREKLNRSSSSDPIECAVFQVGSARNPRKRDIEFRLELCPGDTSEIKGHTLLYWAIDPAKVDATRELAACYTYCTEVSGDNDAAPDRNDALVADPFLVTDGFDNFFGGHPNPHFPPSSSIVGDSLLGKLLATLATGLLLFGGIRLFGSQRR